MRNSQSHSGMSRNDIKLAMDENTELEVLFALTALLRLMVERYGKGTKEKERLVAMLHILRPTLNKFPVIFLDSLLLGVTRVLLSINVSECFKRRLGANSIISIHLA